MANPTHLTRLLASVPRWNAWRASTSEQPDLAQADLAKAHLQRANLSGAELTGANLSRAHLGEANLRGATLRKADLRGVSAAQSFFTNADLVHANMSGAHLSGAYFTNADLSGSDLTDAWAMRSHLYEAKLVRASLVRTNLSGAQLNGTDLTSADLTDADLSGVSLVGAELAGTTLRRCRVYGITAWDVGLAGATQEHLVITRGEHPEIVVDDLEIAQFVYLLINNSNVRRVVDTVTAKVVLLLGRFTPDRKVVLDTLHKELRQRGYVPILFDFDRPASRDTTETVLTLAGMARFVIADLTDAASVQQELTEIVRALPSVPIQPVVLRGDREWSMFPDLQRRGALLAPYVYNSLAELLDALPDRVVAPAEREAERRRAEVTKLYADASARRESTSTLADSSLRSE